MLLELFSIRVVGEFLLFLDDRLAFFCFSQRQPHHPQDRRVWLSSRPGRQQMCLLDVAFVVVLISSNWCFRWCAGRTTASSSLRQAKFMLVDGEQTDRRVSRSRLLHVLWASMCFYSLFLPFKNNWELQEVSVTVRLARVFLVLFF